MEKITVPGSTLRQKVLYLMENYPDLSRAEMAEMLGKSVATIYSYVHEIKKKGDIPKPKKAKKAVIKEETEIFNDTYIDDAPIKEVEKENKNCPSTIEFALTGVNGEQLKKLLFDLVNNSLVDNEEYTIVLSIENIQLPF